MRNEKSFDSIMRSITAGLTGDASKDGPYLMAKCEEYKHHEYGNEILRACGRLLYELVPEDKRQRLDKAMSKDLKGYEATLEEVKFNIYDKNYTKALSIIEELVRKIEATPLFDDDRMTEYHVFDETFQEVLCNYRSKSGKEIRQAPLPYNKIYGLYGSILFELQRYGEARTALQKGLKWNPMDFSLRSEYIETYKVAGDMDSFYRLSVEAFAYAYRAAYVARCYRNIGYYFVEKKQFEVAYACYLLSIQYEESTSAKSELYFIEHTAGEGFNEPTTDDLNRYAEQHGFPPYPDTEIMGLAYHYGKQCLEQSNREAAVYFLGITYELSKDPELKEILEKLADG